MMKVIRWLTDLKRLLAENESLKAENARLQARLDRPPPPAFEQVSSRFEIEGLPDRVYDRVIQDLKPFLIPAAIDALKQVFSREGRRAGIGASIGVVDVAYQRDSHTYQMQFRIPDANSVITVHEELMHGVGPNMDLRPGIERQGI